MPASQTAPSQMDRPTGRPYECGSQVQGGVFGRCAPLVPGRTVKPSIAIAVCGRHLPRCAGPHTWTQAPPCSILQLLTGNLDAYSICSAPVFSTSGQAE